MSVCNRVQVTKNDKHFIRLMSMMEERKDSTQTNILKFIALCDILQTFKSRHQITIHVIKAFAQPIIFRDTVVIGMPPGPPPY